MDLTAQEKFFDYYSKTYDVVQDPICIFNYDGTVYYCNESFSGLTGISQRRFLNGKATVFSAFHSINGAELKIADVEKMNENSKVSILKFETKKIMRGLGQFNVSSFTEDQSQEKLFMMTFKDLTIEEELMKSHQFEVSSLNKKIVEMSHLVDLFQKIRLLNKPKLILNEFLNYLVAQSACHATIVQDKDGMELNVFDSTHADRNSLQQLKQEIDLFLEDSKITKYITHKSKILSPLAQNYHWSVIPFKLEEDHIYIGFIFDSFNQMNNFSHQSAIILSEQLNLVLNNLTLKELSYTDGLTKLKNNLFFRKKMDEVCGLSASAQLILFDIDFFKKINDTYGHPGGDAVLIFLGELLPQIIQKQGHGSENVTVARVGGEEFAILITDYGLEFATSFAEEIRKEVQQATVPFNENEIKFTISMGLASWQSELGFDKDGVRSFYKAADDALYYSKRTGRNKVTTPPSSASVNPIHFHLSLDEIDKILGNFPSIQSKSVKNPQLITNDENKILVTDALSEVDCIDIILSQKAFHILQNSIQKMKDKLSVLGGLLGNNTAFFNAETKFVDGDIYSSEFDLASDRDQVLTDLFKQSGIDSDLEKNKVAIQIGHELLMNAQIDAPKNAKTNKLQKERVKSILILEKSKADKLLAISVIDHYGSLDPYQMMKSIKNASGSKLSLDQTQTLTGAGLGASLLFKNCDSLYIGAVPDQVSRVTVILPLLVSQKHLQAMQKSIHIMRGQECLS